jgi:hypothetical protein
VLWAGAVCCGTTMLSASSLMHMPTSVSNVCKARDQRVDTVLDVGTVKWRGTVCCHDPFADRSTLILLAISQHGQKEGQGQKALTAASPIAIQIKGRNRIDSDSLVTIGIQSRPPQRNVVDVHQALHIARNWSRHSGAHPGHHGHGAPRHLRVDTNSWRCVDRNRAG